MSNVLLQQLCVRLGGHAIITALDLHVARGEFLVLLGPSGCGKSTLLHSIAGLVEVEAGSVEIGGRDVTWADPSERGIGMVFQSYALYPTMTVENNLSFGLRVRGVPKDEIARRVRRTADLLQLAPLLGRKPAQLSGGQRQRVAIGRALVREADVFLFDEPLSNLDAQLRAELRRELKLLHQQLRSTMIYVTHDQAEAMTLATRIAVMRGGSVQQIGTPAEVYDTPANLFVAGFLGAPAMNLLRGTLRTDRRFAAQGFELPIPHYAFRAGAGGERPAVLGLRPEHIRIGQGGPYTGTVSLVEPMGSHQVVWLRAGENLLSAVMHEACPPAVGDPVAFAVDASRVSLFDPVSGLRL